MSSSPQQFSSGDTEQSVAIGHEVDHSGNATYPHGGIPPLHDSPATARRSRVHWGGAANNNNASMQHPPSRLQIGGRSGPTVTLRGSSGGVVRTNHPGPLHLSSRLDDLHLSPHDPAPPPGPATVPSYGNPAEAAEANANSHAAALTLTGAKGLDEEGLDNRAFLELQRELQRHEAQTDPTSDAASWNGGRPTALEQALQTKSHARAERQRRTRFRSEAETTDYAMSGASTPGGTSDSGSYDAAADSDLDHIDFIPGEVDGMPSKPKRNRGIDDEEPKRGWARLRGIMGKDKNGDVEQEEMKQPHEAGGPTNTKSVPVTTSTGVRQGARSRPTKYERQAAKLVKAHRLMTGQGHDGLSDDEEGLERMPSMSRRHLDSQTSTPDPMETAARLDARPSHSGGVLGNLLKLYEQQQQEDRRGRTLSSAAASTADGMSVMSTPDRERQFFSEGLATDNEKASSAPGAQGARRRPESERRRSFAPSVMSSTHWAKRDFGQDATKFANLTTTAASKTLKVVTTEAGFDDVTDERPKAARSSAGVIGGLIATTGNLIGAVSPYHAQLGPNPRRPGYTLDRYLLPEMNAKTLKRTAEAVAHAAPRPYRRSQSQPGTPNPIYSPTNGIMNIMGRPENNASSETQAATPQEKYPPPSTAKTGYASSIMPRKAQGGLLHFPGQAFKSWTGAHTAMNTPDAGQHGGGDYFGATEDDEKLAKEEWQKRIKKRSRDKRKREEIFITMHVAAILQRQEFLLKLSRALMMFGAPTHRIETQIQQTARVLEINCRCIYLPNLMLFAFGDDATHTSETKFIKQAGGLDFTKLTDMHTIYWNVVHDKIGVSEASAQLDELMRRKPLIPLWPMVIIGGFCSSFISLGPMGFGGSFIDAVMAWPLGAFLVYCQSIITTELFSNVFEIVFAALNSFISSAVASTGIFCYAGVVSGSIVLILPGFIVLSGSLELQSKNLIAGSVRMVYAIIYSLFLGFGLSIGSSFWALVSGGANTRSVTTCTAVHNADVWWQKDISLVYALITVPAYSVCLSLRNQAKVNRKEFPAMVVIACAGWACNHFASTAPALNGRQDITSALGSFAVGVLSNLYGRIFDGRSYVVAVTGVLYQLPSGLSNGGLLNFADTTNTTDNFSSGFTVASALVEVALGLTVGLFAATILAHTLGGRKQRVGGLFSF